jgi:probable O-glycosylation ligase (exosortase A-associated)
VRDVAFLAAWLALLPLAFRHAHIGVMLYAWAAFLSPNDYIYGFMRVVPFSKVVAVIAVLATIYDERRRGLYLDSTLLLMILLGICGLVSQFQAAPIASGDAGWDVYQNLLKSILFCFITVSVISTRLRVHSLIFAICLGLGFDGMTEGLKVLASGGSHRILGLGTLGDNNQFALAILMSLPLQSYLYKYSARTVARAAIGGMIVLSVVSVVGTLSRGGFIGLLVLAIGCVASSRRKLATLAIVGLLGLLVFLSAPDSWFSRVSTIETAGDDLSFMGRIVAWKMSLLIALDHPVFGGGFWAVQHQEIWSAYRPFFGVLDFISTPDPDIRAHAAHSIYFEVLGDLGFLGFLLFLGLLLSGFANLFAISKLTGTKENLSWAYDLGKMLRFSFLVYAVSGAALSMAYFELFYMLLAVSSLLRRMVVAKLANEYLHAADGSVDGSGLWPDPVTPGQARVRAVPQRSAGRQ